MCCSFVRDVSMAMVSKIITSWYDATSKCFMTGGGPGVCSKAQRVNYFVDKQPAHPLRNHLSRLFPHEEL